MTMDRSLRTAGRLAGSRSVLSRAERIERLKESERWEEGDSPFGLDKVRVYKIALKKKKKKKAEDEEEEGTKAKK
ncbi:MAG TPA: small basic protein [Thermoguttaceae bacterium]|nr:small basic protein [Thermoguttaceae bacterium]